MKALYSAIISFILALMILPIAMASDLKITVSGAGYVTSGYPSYITCDSQCTSYVPPGADITLTASSYGDSPFAGWGGACSGTEQRCTLNMAGDREVTATFAGQVVTEYELTVYRTGNGKGTIESNPSGVYVGSTFSYDYNKFSQGTTVTLTPTPASDSNFVSWSGDCSSTDGNKCTVAMNSDKQATAEFASAEVVKYTLTVKKTGSGSGAVSSNKNIKCGEVCYEYINEQESVVLIAAPDADSNFDGWGGDCSGTGTCTITISHDSQATATFSLKEKKEDPIQPEPICGGLNQQICDTATCAKYSNCFNGCESPYVAKDGICAECSQGTKYAQGKCASISDDGYYNLILTKKGPGTVTAPFYKIYCGQYCSAKYREGSIAELSAYPDEGGATFSGWEGDCTGIDGKCSLTMDSEKKVTAIFKGHIPNYKLTVNVSGQGKVTSANIDCGEKCLSQFVEGTLVELTAAPETDKKLKEWQGACIHNESVCSITMDGHKSVNAIFVDAGKRKLKLSFKGNGTVYFPGGPRGADMTEEFVNNRMKSRKFNRFCRKNCTSEWPVDSKLRLVPEPADGYDFGGWVEFEGWEELCYGQNHCIMRMDAHKQVTALFRKLPQKHNLTINTIGNGIIAYREPGPKSNMINCSGQCTAAYFEGWPVVMIAYPGHDSEFASWSGDCSGENKTCNLNIDSGRKVTAEFRQHNYTISVKTPSRGRVKSEDGRIDCGDICNATYLKGSKVFITPYPDQYAKFLTWNGTCIGDSQCLLNVDTDKKVTAIFNSSRYNLTIIKAGSGQVDVLLFPGPYIPFDFACDGLKCIATREYQNRESIGIMFNPERTTVMHDVSWDCGPAEHQCLIVMNNDKKIIVNSSVNATIEKFILKVSKSGEGLVVGENLSGYDSIDCGAKCEASPPAKDRYILTAKPAMGWKFHGWEGACNNERETCVILSPSGTIDVKAKFGRTFKLKVNKAGTGKGTIISNPVGINCKAECDTSYPVYNYFSAPVTLTATSEPGHKFDGWSGDCYTYGECLISGEKDAEATATFYECYYSSDTCLWNQYCDEDYFKCVDIPCECGEIQNHECRKYECCEDRHCNLYQKCNTDQRKCVEQNRCFNYLLTGGRSQQLDLVIIGDGFETNDDLDKEIARLVEGRTVSSSGTDGLFDINPFKENQKRFNVWFRNVKDLKHNTDGSPDWDDTKKWAETCPRDFVVVFSKKEFRSYAFMPIVPWWGGTAYISLTPGDKKFHGRKLAHELGHAIGSLADEYTEEGKGILPNFINCAPHESIARLMWGDLAGKDGVGYFTGEPDGGCSYVKSNVRPTYNSLMRYHTKTDKFGPVNERQLNKVLDNYK